jgi:carboxypeptidase Taq
VEGWELEDVLAHVHRIERGLIRVDADESTYPLHVILRFEIEKDLIEGRLQPREVPEAWDAKMSEYLGLRTIEDPANGPMQDVHWPSGAFGYFPSYTLGAMIAAQQWVALEKALPDAREDVRNGRFVGINDWRREHIWAQGSRYSTPELLERATGEPLTAAHFAAHLRGRYLA